MSSADSHHRQPLLGDQSASTTIAGDDDDCDALTSRSPRLRPDGRTDVEGEAIATAAAAAGEVRGSEVRGPKAKGRPTLPKVAIARGAGGGGGGSAGGESRLFRIFKKSSRSAQQRPMRAADPRPKVRRYNLLSRDRLKVPMRNSDGFYFSDQGRPLVDIGSDENDDYDDDWSGGGGGYCDTGLLKRLTNADIREQLLRDGYNLAGVQPGEDDLDLDLVPPQPSSASGAGGPAALGFHCCKCFVSCQIL